MNVWNLDRLFVHADGSTSYYFDDGVVKLTDKQAESVRSYIIEGLLQNARYRKRVLLVGIAANIVTAAAMITALALLP